MFIVIKHIHINRANAFNDLAIGFPAITQWMGSVYGLEYRMWKSHKQKLYINGAGICCHHCVPHIHYYRYNGKKIGSCSMSRNTCKQDGSNAPFVTKASVSLDVSLVLDVEGNFGDNTENVLELIRTELEQHKMAAGSVYQPIDKIMVFGDDDDTAVLKALMPGYMIVAYHKDIDIDDQDMQQYGQDALGKMLYSQSINVDNYKSGHDGWVIPLITGFYEIENIGSCNRFISRNRDYKNIYGSSIVELCECVMPIRFEYVEEALWHVQDENGLYKYCN